MHAQCFSEAWDEVFLGRLLAEEISYFVLARHLSGPVGFVIARAVVEKRIVVTTELMKPHAVKIPNICAHFGVGCMSLAEFMDAENWTF